ncbi:MAG: VOC family protein [Acidobacteria bacterium]|nr:VOC family protein [Acidobacteriota bacterium]
MKITPYLDFAGRCDEAIGFYQAALGAEVIMKMRFGDSPDKSMCPPGSEDRIMHSAMKIGDTTIFAADGPGGTGAFNGISLALDTPSIEECEAKFNALAAGGAVQMPLMETFFSKRFGILTDKYGVPWMFTVNVA